MAELSELLEIIKGHLPNLLSRESFVPIAQIDNQGSRFPLKTDASVHQTQLLSA